MTAALLGLLYLILALSLDAAGWVEDMSLLLPIAAGGVLMGLLMSFSRFDGFFMLTHSFSTGLAWVMFWMTRLVAQEEWVQGLVANGVPPLQARSYFLLDRWLSWLQAALGNAASNDNYVFILEISFLLWWLAYLGTWTAFRHGHVWRTVFMAGTALLVNTYYAPNSVMAHLVLFSTVALLLLAWTNLVSQRQRWRAFQVHFSPDIGFDFMRTGFLYTLAVLLIAFVAPNFGRSPQIRQLLQPLNRRWEATTAEWNRLYQGLNRQTRPTVGVFGRSLTLGGERNVTPTLVMQVDSTTGRYWRAITYDTFTGRQWLNTATEEASFPAGEPVVNPNWPLREPLTQTITLMAPTGNVIFAAPDLMQASVPLAGLVTTLLEPDTPDGEMVKELTWARSQQPLEVGESYTVVSRYAKVTQRDLREAGTDYPPEILERYLQLPENFSPRVAELAQQVSGAYTNPYDMAKSIEGFLRGYAYDDQIAAPGPDQDPTEYFLFEIKRGYCNYYATAMAVMLRSLGVPTRLASGYAEGTLDKDSGLYFITEQDSHTWVEVYFPGLGWIEFEPTAGESVLTRPSGLELEDTNRGGADSAPDLVRDNLPEMDEGINLEEQLNRQLDSQPGSGFFFKPTIGWILGTLALALAAIAAGWWMLWSRPSFLGPSAFDALPQPVFYRRLLTWGKRLGLLVSPSQTPYERAELFARSVPVGAPLIRRITDSYVRYRYANHAHQPDPEERAALGQAWSRLQPILWKAWLRRLWQRRPFARKGSRPDDQAQAFR